MAATNNKLDEAFQRISRSDASLSALELRWNQVRAHGLGEALITNPTVTSLDPSELKTNSTLTTLHLYGNKAGDEGAGRLAEALAMNSSLTRFHFNCDLNSR